MPTVLNSTRIDWNNSSRKSYFQDQFAINLSSYPVNEATEHKFNMSCEAVLCEVESFFREDFRYGPTSLCWYNTALNSGFFT